MEPIKALSTLLPIAVSSGINLYATILIVGLCIRYQLIDNVPTMFHVFGSPIVIVVAGILYFIEFFADKIQFVDQLWDGIHTFVRPFGAAVIAFTAIADVDPHIALLAALISGSAAMVSHSGKAGGRIALNVLSPAENISNITVSIGEDVLVAGLVVLALKYPYVAAIIASLLLVLITYFIPQLLGWLWLTLCALVAWLRGAVKPIEQSDVLAEEHRAVLPTAPLLTGKCRALNLRGIADSRNGFLSLVGSDVYFTYRGWWSGIKQWHISEHAIHTTTHTKRALMDIVTFHYRDAKGREREARFAFTKERRWHAEQYAMQYQA